jgi:hypothetical protein
MRKLIALIAAGALALSLTGTAAAKPVSVWKDASGDAGNQDGALPGAAEAGFDLTGGSIDKVGKDLVFTVQHASMPASNQPGEAFRFLWHIDVGGKQYRFTVKTTDIGKPDAIANSGTERVGQVYQGVARLEEGYTDATLPLTLSQFSVLEYYEVTFDAAEGTMTWKMPLAALKLKPGSKVIPGTGGSTGTGCQICWVPHYAERSLTPQTTIDTAFQSVTYTVPK